ncbi:MAG: AbrB/MazE/SpoVT family DNA-binding domain-containing protein [Armatimonadota bacterium]|jgi:AbrB family looped-hinge helix DNA binding protein
MLVRASKKCQIVIPAELRRDMGIQAGDYFDIKASDGRIVLIPLGADPIEAAHGMLADGPSLTQELLRERAADREREERKLARWLP